MHTVNCEIRLPLRGKTNCWNSSSSIEERGMTLQESPFQINVCIIATLYSGISEV